MYTIPIFIGSSTEGLPVARSLRGILHRHDVGHEYRLSVTLWDQRSVFGVGESTIGSLSRALDSYAFALMVLTPDDVAQTRRKVVKLPRDNVLFELGLFMGRLGVRRSYMVVCGKAKIPTDLKGIKVARIQIPKPRRSFAKLLPAEAKKAVIPAANEILEAVNRELREGALQSTVHYMAPRRSYSDYYNHFQVLLETELAPLSGTSERQGGRLSWRFHPHKGDSLDGTYRRIKEVLRDTRSEDILVFVPQGLHNRVIYREFKGLLRKYVGRRIILFDQPPPEEVLKGPNIGFVGPDNQQIGDLAAKAVCDLLGQRRVHRACFYAVSGPGGSTRVKAFRGALEKRAGKRPVKTIRFVDDVRTKNLARAAQFMRQLPPRVPIAVFAGNDECAFALLEEKRRKSQRVCIVGCDAIPAMRREVEISADRSLATIDTQLPRQAKAIRHLIEQKQYGRSEEVSPRLIYPKDCS